MQTERVKAERVQVNWRINKETLDNLQEEAKLKGFSSRAALANYIFAMRYVETQKGE